MKTVAAVYWLCELAKTDARFAKYPRLPVIECSGFQPRAGPPAGREGDQPDS